jgi:hypothetical protein
VDELIELTIRIPESQKADWLARAQEAREAWVAENFEDGARLVCWADLKSGDVIADGNSRLEVRGPAEPSLFEPDQKSRNLFDADRNWSTFTRAEDDYLVVVVPA